MDATKRKRLPLDVGEENQPKRTGSRPTTPDISTEVDKDKFNVINNNSINKIDDKTYTNSSESVNKNDVSNNVLNKNSSEFENNDSDNNLLINNDNLIKSKFSKENIKNVKTNKNFNSDPKLEIMSFDPPDNPEINLRKISKKVTQDKKVTFDNLPDGGIKINKHINMVQNSNIEPYNIVEDIATTKCNINMGQLLDLAPKARNDLAKSLRPDKVKLVSSIDFSEYAKDPPAEERVIKEEDIGLVGCHVDNTSGRLLVDSGSNLNLVSSSFLDKLPGQYEQVGYCRGHIYEALGDNTIADAIVIRLTVNINSFSFTANFCVVEHEHMYFELLIGLKTITFNALFIHPLCATLCRFINKFDFETIAPLLEDQDEETVICFLKCTGSEKLINTFKLEEISDDDDFITSLRQQVKEESLSPKEYIRSPQFSSSLDENYKEEIVETLDSYIDVVATSSEELTPSDLGPHHIQLVEGAKPVKSKFYKLNKFKSDILKEELIKLLEKGLIVPAKSSWSSPIVLVKKKNGKWRLCNDYRRVNALTVPDVYSLPNIEEIFDSLAGATVFSTLDLFSGYHQILMAEDSIDITGFTTKFGNFVYKVMPFGLTGAPATFQREMNSILLELLGKSVYVFLDDILIFSKNKEEHLAHLKEVLEIFRKHKIKLNIEKCHFFKEEVEVLGHMVTKDGLTTMESKVEAVKNWTKPNNINEIRSFLGTVGYYRKFIPNFSKLAAPLTVLLRKNCSFKWGEEQQFSFDTLKTALINAPILKFPDYNKQFIIRTDACAEGIGGALLQKDEDGVEHPIHYISRTLTKAERNYSTTDLEGTAVYYCADKFKPYISGNLFETLLYTDHKPLVGLFKNKEPNNMRHIRWCILISMLRIKIIYEPGKKNSLADALSRIKNSDEGKDILVNKNDNNNPGQLPKNEKENKGKLKGNTINKETLPQTIKKGSKFKKKDSCIKEYKNFAFKVKNFSIIKTKNFSNENSKIYENKNLREINGYIENFKNSTQKNGTFEKFLIGDNNVNLFNTTFNICPNELNNIIDNILQYNNNIYSDIEHKIHISEIYTNKLNKELNQLNKLKQMVNQYMINKMQNIESYISEYNDNLYKDNFTSNLKDFKDQFYQQMNNILEYINNIQKNKTNGDYNHTYKISTINVEQPEQQQVSVTEFMEKFLEENIIEENGEKYIIDNGQYRKIIEKEEDKFNLILKAHSVGHEGFEKTYERLKRTSYWKGMTKDIKKFLKLCTTCQLNKKNETPDPTEKYATQVEAPFTHLGLDIIGPLPITERNNQYILVIVDYFTKWVEAEATPSVTAKDVVYFLTKVFARHGTPCVITTDNGTQFTADYTKIFLDLYDVYIRFITTYHPESNGLTENRNREIGKLLRLMGAKEENWDLVLPSALWALRTAKNSVTKYSSFELLYGRKDQQPFELATSLPTSYVLGTKDEQLIQKFIDHHKWVLDACENIKKNNQYWTQRREEETRFNHQNEIQVGDLVKVRNFTRHKLEPYFVGPYKVIKKQFNTVSLVDPNLNLKLERPVHLKNVIKFHTTMV